MPDTKLGAGIPYLGIQAALGGLRRRRFAAACRGMDGWSLEEIRARHGRRPPAETQNNPVLARRVEYYVASLEGGLRELRCRRDRCGAVAYLAGYANGALYTMFGPDAELDDCGYTTAAIRLAAECRLAA